MVSPRYRIIGRRVIVGAVAFHLLWVFWGWTIAFLAALPIGGTADWLILLLTDCRHWVEFPRRIWFAMWPFEETPRWINWLVSLLTGLTWGAVFAVVRTKRQKLPAFPDSG
jgi:hypothetical protein